MYRSDNPLTTGIGKYLLATEQASGEWVHSKIIIKFIDPNSYYVLSIIGLYKVSLQLKNNIVLLSAILIIIIFQFKFSL